MILAAFLGGGGGLEGVGVLLERMQRVRDVLKGGQDRAAILFGGLGKGGLGGALPMPQGAAIEDGLRHARAQIPKAVALREHLAEGHRRAAGIGGQGKVGQPVGNGDANLGAGGMEVFLGLAHIGALLDQLGGKAQRQFLRQFRFASSNFSGKSWLGNPPASAASRSRCCANCFEQRRQGGDDLRELRFLRRHIELAGITLRDTAPAKSAACWC